MSVKKPQQSIIIANDLRTGRSVYLTDDSQWSENASKAAVVTGDVAESRLQLALEDEHANRVIDPYLVGVELNSTASAIRERIRVSGPTILYGDHNAATVAA